jgi:hypothetical protein
MARIGIVAVFFLTACASAGPVATPAPVTVSGAGVEKSATIALEGNYAVAWSVTVRPEKCLTILTLESPTDKAVLETLADDDAAASGSTHVYGLARGSYFVNGDLNSCGPWTVTLSPVP